MHFYPNNPYSKPKTTRGVRIRGRNFVGWGLRETPRLVQSPECSLGTMDSLFLTQCVLFGVITNQTGLRQTTEMSVPETPPKRARHNSIGTMPQRLCALFPHSDDLTKNSLAPTLPAMDEDSPFFTRPLT